LLWWRGEGWQLDGVGLGMGAQRFQSRRERSNSLASRSLAMAVELPVRWTWKRWVTYF